MVYRTYDRVSYALIMRSDGPVYLLEHGEKSLSALDPWLRLALAPGVGNTSLIRLLTAFGSPEAGFGVRALRTDAASVCPLSATRCWASPTPPCLRRRWPGSTSRATA